MLGVKDSLIYQRVKNGRHFQFNFYEICHAKRFNKVFYDGKPLYVWLKHTIFHINEVKVKIYRADGLTWPAN